MDILRLPSAKNITSVSQIDSQSTFSSNIVSKKIHIKSVDLNETDLDMIESATALMKESEDVDMSRVAHLKEKMNSRELNFDMHDVVRALTRN